MSSTARILLGLILGALVGLALAWLDPALATRAGQKMQLAMHA